MDAGHYIVRRNDDASDFSVCGKHSCNVCSDTKKSNRTGGKLASISTIRKGR